MGVFEMVVLVVLIGTIGSIYKYRLKSGHRIADLEEQLRNLGIADQLARIDALEERVRTLERIATDRGEKLRREIDAL
ncbi:MAG: hypothetical protein ACE5ED_12075 [Rhodothalassiaceae bacterium]